MGWKALPDEQKAKLEKLLEAHEQANPVAQIKKTDGAPIGPECKPQVPGESDDAAE